MKIYLFFVFLFSQSAFAHSNEANIIGGTIVTASDWISQTVVALVSSDQQGQALCTASLVASDLAITAAHCVTSENPGTKAVLTLIFSHDLHNTNPVIREVDRVEVPSEWNPINHSSQDTSDMAVVHFSGGLPAGYFPSDLLPFDYSLNDGAEVILAGYGISDTSSNSGAGILRKTQVNIMNPNYSNSEVEFDQSKGGGACHGDSGGPAYLMINHHPYLFGVTSRGGGNCDQDVIYTKLSSYQDWFQLAVNALRK